MEIDFADLIGMAGDTSGMIKNSLSALAEFRNLAKSGKLPAEAGETILTLSTQLSEAQVKLAHLESEIVRLQRHQEAHDEIKQRKRNYKLSKTAMGEFIYQLKEDAGTGEMPHAVCPDCFERDLIRVLQPREYFLHCVSCQNDYQTRKLPTAVQPDPFDDPY